MVGGIAGGDIGWRIVSSGDIVVGVDQSPEARWAVRWGAREARLRGATLALAHIKSSVSDDRTADDLDSEAGTLLIVRAAEASELEPGISVVSPLPCVVVGTLTLQAYAAESLKLQHRQSHGTGRERPAARQCTVNRETGL